MRLLLATTNLGKVRELADLCRPLPVQVRSLIGEDAKVQAAETGQTFAENAWIKARAAAAGAGHWTLADDSGLCVDALGGAPGIHSARWSGEGDAGNNAKLLRELSTVEGTERGAVYRCALALVHPDGREFVFEGEVRGRILKAPQGEGGFGYDPFFEVPELGVTFAQLPLYEKQRISHRGRAFEKLAPLLERLAKYED